LRAEKILLYNKTLFHCMARFFRLQEKTDVSGWRRRGAGAPAGVVFEAESPLSPPLGPLFRLHLGAAPVE